LTPFALDLTDGGENAPTPLDCLGFDATFTARYPSISPFLSALKD